MSLYYVSVVLVVSGDDEGHAEGVSEDGLGGLLKLKPKGLGGYTLLKAFATAPASVDWFKRDQAIRVEIGKGIYITEDYCS